MKLTTLTATLCLTIGAAEARPLATLTTEPWGGTFSGALCMVPDPLDATTIYVVQQNGIVRTVRDGVQLAEPFANLGASGTNLIIMSAERGLLGMVFSPNFAQDRRVYFNFTGNGAPPPNPPGALPHPSGATIIARYKVPTPAIPGGALQVDDASRFDLSFGYDEGTVSERWIEQPFTTHKGGTLHFGPDGMLYIAMGDGGGGGPAQDPDSLLGKVLRLDAGVSDADAEGYNVPATNPFLPGNMPPALATFDARPQIWAFGLRNPWKHSFDNYGHGRTGGYYIADVGQSEVEEVDYQAPGVGGANYGWARFEGNLLLQPGTQLAYDEPGTNHRYMAPAHAYSHAVGSSVSGGYVYRGQAMCSYKGRYFFGDFSGRVWSARLGSAPNGPALQDVVEHLALGGGLVVGFGRDLAGGLYVIKLSSILRITSNDAPMGGDADGDRDVDFGDLNYVLSQYTQTGPAGGTGLFGDVNDDGAVNFEDLNTVLSNFGRNCL